MHVYFKEFSIGCEALYLASNSVSARTRGREFQARTGRGKEGAENWQECADIPQE